MWMAAVLGARLARNLWASQSLPALAVTGLLFGCSTGDHSRAAAANPGQEPLYTRTNRIPNQLFWVNFEKQTHFQELIDQESRSSATGGIHYSSVKVALILHQAWIKLLADQSGVTFEPPAAVFFNDLRAEYGTILVRGTARQCEAVRRLMENLSSPSESPSDTPLRAGITVPQPPHRHDSRLDAQLVLTNTSKVPIRVCTLCQGWRSTEKGRFDIRLDPENWKSDAPGPEQSAKQVAEIEPGGSVSIPFEIFLQGREPLRVTASYSVGVQFAHKLKIWSGTVVAGPIIVAAGE